MKKYRVFLFFVSVLLLLGCASISIKDIPSSFYEYHFRDQDGNNAILWLDRKINSIQESFICNGYIQYGKHSEKAIKCKKITVVSGIYSYIAFGETVTGSNFYINSYGAPLP
ncbi:MAG: hypothetical protein Q7K21_06020 [Elusimicrobiota bacterium]|nr:hypothetical protein [Elusimicrobiota bacterium]